MHLIPEAMKFDQMQNKMTSMVKWMIFERVYTGSKLSTFLDCSIAS